MTARTHMIGGLRTFALALALLFAGLNGAAAQQQSTDTLNNQQIEQLVAPIALYPDDLLSQVLMASTYPLEVVEAARWVKENQKVTGQALQDAMQKQSWDPSVKSLAAVPQTLAMMNDQIKWTQDLGDAFLGQQGDVLDAVQRLRGRAEAAGNLKSTPQQKVTRASGRPGRPRARPRMPTRSCLQNPEEYFVPVYDPTVVYGAWPYDDYLPFYWYPPDWGGGYFGIWRRHLHRRGDLGRRQLVEPACARQSAPFQPVQSHQHHQHELAAQRRAPGQRPVPQRQRRQAVRRCRQGRGAGHRAPEAGRERQGRNGGWHHRPRRHG